MSMFEGLFQPLHLIIILVLVLIVFGAGKLPDAAGGFGRGIREFKKSMNDDETVTTETVETTTSRNAPAGTVETTTTRSAPVGTISAVQPTCPSCGAELPAGAHFCANCGSKIAA
jgi:sec-independent protein translocase protein TatA